MQLKLSTKNDTKQTHYLKKDNWTIPSNINEDAFDFSWHPDATSPAYIYRFPTQWALSGGPIYTVEDAEEVKYVEDQVSKALPCRDNWVFDSKLIRRR